MKHIGEIARMAQMIILFDNDIAIADWLSDLKDRRICKYIDDSYRDMIAEGKENYTIVMKSRLDDLYILVIYNAPFGPEKAKNKLMLYAHSSIRELCVYFKRSMESNQSSDERIQRGLSEITQLLYFQYAQEEDGKTPLNFMG